MFVVYVSSATDVRATEDLLRAHGRDYRIEFMGMASAEQRARFAEMKQAQSWSSLPMIFDDKQFIGGQPELERHLAERRPSGPGARAARGTGLAKALGIGGLIPFVALGLACVAGARIGGFAPLPLLLSYAATILSFIGAVHWGMAVAANPESPIKLFAASVIPALWAWASLALPASLAPSAFVIGFAGCYLWERYTIWATYPAWYRGLRTLLTPIVCAALPTVALI